MAWQVLSAAGLVDAWVEAEGADPRFTAAFGDDLDTDPSILDNTVDYVLHDSDGVLDAVVGSAEVVGDELQDRTLDHQWWPSDHAAVVVTLKFTKT